MTPEAASSLPAGPETMSATAIAILVGWRVWGDKVYWGGFGYATFGIVIQPRDVPAIVWTAALMAAALAVTIEVFELAREVGMSCMKVWCPGLRREELWAGSAGPHLLQFAGIFSNAFQGHWTQSAISGNTT